MDEVDMQAPVSRQVMEVSENFAFRDSIRIVYGLVGLTANAFEHRKVVGCQVSHTLDRFGDGYLW